MCSAGCISLSIRSNQCQPEYERLGNAVECREVPNLITLRRLRMLQVEEVKYLINADYLNSLICHIHTFHDLVAVSQLAYNPLFKYCHKLYQ